MTEAVESFLPGATVAAVINTAVKNAEERGGVSHRELAHTIDVSARQVGVESGTRAYIDALCSFTHNVAVEPLPDGVGGQFGTSITMATATMEVGEAGCSQTIAQMQEVYKHELYHATNHHTDAMRTFGDSTVIIAGEGFTTTNAIEALTVEMTGDIFVSGDYQSNNTQFFAKIDNAGLTIHDVQYAINEKHDLTLIDDRMFDPIIV